MVKVMDEKYRLDIDDLENVTGGTQVAATTPRFSVGDRVTIRLYPEYGVGTVTNVYINNSMWTCQVYFDAGVMDASQDEFLPA